MTPASAAARSGQSAVEKSEYPRVWCLLGHRTGDNNQVLALAEELGWPFETKALEYNALFRISNRVSPGGRYALTRDSRALLTPPWPDVVIGIGRRSVAVSRWIKAQSGGRCQIVHLGWPRCDPRRLDHVITTPNYPVPPAENVLVLPASMSRISPEKLEAAAAEWTHLEEIFPKPWSVLVLGGPTKPWRLTPERAREACRTLIEARGEGSVLAVSSRRTPKAVEAGVGDLLRSSARPGDLFTPDDPRGNAYLGLLAHAEEVAVTGDSVAMVSDAIAAGKKVAVIPVEASKAGGAVLSLFRALRPPQRPGPLDPRPVLARLGVTDWRRDVSVFWQEALSKGLVGEIGRARRADLARPAETAAGWLQARLASSS